jgi:hypothetical protein
MNGRRKWAVAGTAAVLGVSGAVANAALALNDPAPTAKAGQAVTLAAAAPALTATEM